MTDNENKNPNPEASAKEALSRARAARQILREQAEEKQRAAEEKIRLRRAFQKNALCRSCVLYTVLNLLHFLLYLALIYPIKGQPFADMIRGGTSVRGHLIFLAAAVFTALVYSLILYRRQTKPAGAVRTYLVRTCCWFTPLMFLLIAAHGIYMDMLYNEYAVTQSAIFLGPSFLLAFSTFGFSLCLTAANRIYCIRRFPAAIRAMLHLAATMVLAAVFFHILPHGFASAADFLVFLAIFSTLYALVCVFCLAARAAVRREENDEEEYESVYMTPELRRQHSQNTTQNPK